MRWAPVLTAAVLVAIVAIAGNGLQGGGLSGGGSSGASISPCSVNASGLSCPTDAGFANIVQASIFTSTYSGVGSAVDGGANFLCNNNPAASSPCVANYGHPLEMGGFVATPSDALAANVYLGALDQVRDGGFIVVALNGYGVQAAESEQWEVDYIGNTQQNGNATLGINNGSGRVLCPTGSCYSVGAGAAIIWNNTSSGDSADFFADPGGTEVVTIDHGGAIHSVSTKTVGTITLSGGTGTATVNSGTHCVCDDSTATAIVKCAVSSTTLTATGTGTDVITYICL